MKKKKKKLWKGLQQFATLGRPTVRVGPRTHLRPCAVVLSQVRLVKQEYNVTLAGRQSF